MRTTDHLTVPPSNQLRADIRARVAELRDLRRLLRLAEAAESLRQRQAEKNATNDTGNAR